MTESARLIIRDARRADRQAAHDVTMSAYQQYATAMPDWAWSEYRQNLEENVLHPEPAQQFVAELDGAIVGSVLLFPPGYTSNDPDPAVAPQGPEIRLLAVAPTARGQGIGKALVQECIRRAREVGYSVIHLHTTEIMQIAMEMYERMGFERAPELDFAPAPDILIKGYRMNLSA
ncbi:MAG: GNAT family N-acetyltransferase [Anaerolineae bacterium]